MREQRIVVDDMAQPIPSEGEVLVKTLACGICGSDLHALKHDTNCCKLPKKLVGRSRWILQKMWY